MQSAQHDHLKQLIESSVILTPIEKSEWLDMLIIMNDKQAGELESILKTETAPPAQGSALARSSDLVRSSTPARLSVPPVAGVIPPNLPMADISRDFSGRSSSIPNVVPKLSHISNLPSGLISGGNIGQQQPAKVNLPANPPKPTVIPPINPPKPSVVQPINSSKPNVALPALPSVVAPALKPATPKPVASPVFAAPAPKQVPNAGPAQLESITDAGKLTVSSMRSLNSSDLLLRLQQLSKLEGYFSLLSYLEDSPLYKAYIATGKKMLSGQPQVDQGKSDSDILSKSEFEAFADILRKIQIN